MKEKTIKKLEVQFPNKILSDYMANFFGQQSSGRVQVRGNGALILTESELFFMLWLPEKEFSIPLQSILKVETPRHFLGKSVGYRLLKIDFKNSQQDADAAAWFVKDLDTWTKEISARIEMI